MMVQCKDFRPSHLDPTQNSSERSFEFKFLITLDETKHYRLDFYRNNSDN